MVGQVGSDARATKFLQDIRNDTRIQDVVFVASGNMDRSNDFLETAPINIALENLDVASSSLENDWKMDEWVRVILLHWL
jgi:hypothetical protein